MPADLTPVQARAAEVIEAVNRHAVDFAASIRHPDANQVCGCGESFTYPGDGWELHRLDTIAAILARVTPTETPTDPLGMPVNDLDTEPGLVEALRDAKHAPTAVPGVGEVERIKAEACRELRDSAASASLDGILPELNHALATVLEKAAQRYEAQSRAAITALRDGEVGE